ncbi:hypothetical protein OG555_13050 [Kribbella sp. NBC_01484]|uniref:hypothetical protein n=1 Tax=Kribbella sp. NBC_01484 TaxID=2903579 RepID=UPI002E3284E9|nr:hypothetical protein [Kribbella sp. NBC_01484]
MITTTTGASAAEPPDGIVWDHTYTAPGVKVYVEEHGDIISVCDTSKNGYAAWVLVTDRVGVQFQITARNGVGSCETTQADDGLLHDLYEGDRIDLHLDGDGDEPGGAYEAFVNDH